MLKMVKPASVLALGVCVAMGGAVSVYFGTALAALAVDKIRSLR